MDEDFLICPECYCRNGKHNDDCVFASKKQESHILGWICPKCGRGNSPYTSTCPCVPIDMKVTC